MEPLEQCGHQRSFGHTAALALSSERIGNAVELSDKLTTHAQMQAVVLPEHLLMYR